MRMEIVDSRNEESSKNEQPKRREMRAHIKANIGAAAGRSIEQGKSEENQLDNLSEKKWKNEKE